MIVDQVIARRPRPGADRRAALQAVANIGHGSTRPERFRAVIYTTGITSVFAPEMDRLREYVEGRYWILSGTYFDENDTEPATARQALGRALSAIRTGEATALVIDESSFDALSPTGRTWLKSEIDRFGGFIAAVPADGTSG
jgi:hypothetical protein